MNARAAQNAAAPTNAATTSQARCTHHRWWTGPCSLLVSVRLTIKPSQPDTRAGNGNYQFGRGQRSVGPGPTV